MSHPKFFLELKDIISKEIKDLQAANKDHIVSSEIVELDQACTGRLTRMDALQQQAMAKANHQRSVLRLKQLNAALIKIENEDYGLCFDCEEDIAQARLKANPTATLCISCAEKKEKRPS